jgi:hypothetical protein
LILLALKDNDAKVVCAAAESLYNIMKYYPNLVIPYFSELFEGLLLINVNPDSEVRNLAHNLDSLMKEIINFKFQDNEIPQELNLKEFFQKIYQKISAKHPFIKILIVSWIIFINSIPEIKILNVLHEFLPSLFVMLSEKQKDVSQSAEKCLKDLLKEVDQFFEQLTYEVEVKIVEILIDQCRSLQPQTKLTAFEWIFLFLGKYKYFLIQNKKNKSPYTKSVVINNKLSTNVMNKTTGPFHTSNNSSISVFEPTSIDFSFKEDQLTSNLNEFGERRIPFYLFPKILDIIISSINHPMNEIRKIALDSNTELIAILEFYAETRSTLGSNTNVKLFEEVLRTYFSDEKESTLDMVIKWINLLFKRFHEEMFTKIESFIDSFTGILSHSNDSLFNNILDIICEIAKYKDEYIEIILSKILEKLCANKNLLKHKGLTILKKFCTILQVDRVYLTFAEVLIRMKDMEFVGKMINILDIFLLAYKVFK